VDLVRECLAIERELVKLRVGEQHHIDSVGKHGVPAREELGVAAVITDAVL
jgi:hypothetical protein